ncbi:MAG TPA: hypothetical protein VFS21_28545 [Roseiflexaceae bacterium]|nr:hypothetical protein [Roseiflexaceae bacterium]
MKVIVLAIDAAAEAGIYEVELDINETVMRFPVQVTTCEIDDQELWITDSGEAFDKAVQGLNIANEIHRLVRVCAQGEALDLQV